MQSFQPKISFQDGGGNVQISHPKMQLKLKITPKNHLVWTKKVQSQPACPNHKIQCISAHFEKCTLDFYYFSFLTSVSNATFLSRCFEQLRSKDARLVSNNARHLEHYPWLFFLPCFHIIVFRQPCLLQDPLCSPSTPSSSSPTSFLTGTIEKSFQCSLLSVSNPWSQSSLTCQ